MPDICFNLKFKVSKVLVKSIELFDDYLFAIGYIYPLGSRM